MRKLLLTGFEPFGGEPINPAVEAVRRLQGRGVGPFEVVGLELPTVFGQSVERLLSCIKETEPEVVIALGQAGGRKGISFERIAVNLSDAAIADNAGYRPVDVPVVPEGPAAYWTTLPVKRMAERLQEKGIPASLSLSAGTFVCNHVFLRADAPPRCQRQADPGRVHPCPLPAGTGGAASRRTEHDAGAAHHRFGAGD